MNKKNVYFEKPPCLWWLLSEADKYQYHCLKMALALTSEKNQRNQRLNSFNKCIEAVKSFAIRGDNKDNIRSYICGIVWLKDGIAINTHYLKALISKCKSSINGSLQKMGLTINVSRTEAIAQMTAAFPNLKENTSELRKWSIRKMPNSSSNTQVKEQCSEAKDVPVEPISYENAEDPSIPLSLEKDIHLNDIWNSNFFDEVEHFDTF